MATERTYHHGDLRAALIERALQIVESQGHEAVSLRALAEELGVSRGAPYRHFPERDYLLADVAASGFERLHAFAGTGAPKRMSAKTRLVNAAQQFLRFVDTYPQLFRLMYDSGLVQRANDFPALAAAQKASYDKIFMLYAATLPPTDALDGELRAKVIAFWSTIFGYAKIRQAALLQAYMLEDLSAPEVEAQVIRTATGFDRMS